MISKDETKANFELASVASDKAVQFLKTSQKLKDGDTRLSFFYKTRTLNHMFSLNYTFYTKYLLTHQYWEDNFPDYIISNKNKTKLCDEYEVFIRSNFIIELYGAFESSLRVIAEAIDPTYYNQNKRSFYKISKKMLDDFKLTEEHKLINIFSNIRNIIHSNGLFQPLDGKDETIQYKGKTFLFEVGKPVIYAGWADLLSISKLIHFLFLNITNQTEVVKISYIKEPTSDFWSKLDDLLPNP